MLALLCTSADSRCIERFFRTLKEQLLWVRRFHNMEELRETLVAFRETYNEHWIVERLKYQTPNQARRTFSLALREAA
ncbi:MAG: integrase core domain-containing protein [Bryobacteraceae bacterium]